MKIPLFAAAQIELTEGCNRYCRFCGIRSIRSGALDRLEFASTNTIRSVASSLKAASWKGRIELAMHGEPLLNPNYLDCISILRQALPEAQIQVTTNGKALMGKMESKINRIFLVGANFIVMDTYEPERDELRAEAIRMRTMRVVDLYAEQSPEKFTPYQHHHGKMDRTVIMLDDLGKVSGKIRSRTINNHSGNSTMIPPVNEPLRKTCTKPFRELSVASNGDVLFCCQDWKHILTGGNANELDAVSIWQSEKFHDHRRRLQNKDRTFDPCRMCDCNAGPRAGLLPRYR